jgi:hypothetical protein
MTKVIQFLKHKKKFIAQGMLLFLLFFGVLFVLVGIQAFGDETDNFVGGMLVAAGQDVYQVHTSQHMPFMYYLCAVFRLLGSSTIYTYRLAFFMFLSFLWTIMYFRYSPHFGKSTMVFYPIFYAFEMAATSLAATVLSEQMQAQGMVILLMEFLIFIEKKEIKLSNCIWVSLAVVFSFGTAFVSIYAIFVIFIGVLAVHFYQKTQNNVDRAETQANFYKQLGRLAIVVLLPFAVLILWYALSGNLSNFYLGAYKVNVDIYPKYTGGYGINPLSAALSRLSDYFAAFMNGINTLPTAPGDALRIVLRTAIHCAFLLMLLKRHWIYACIVSCFILVTGMRGYAEFHALPYFGITVWMLAFMLNRCYAAVRKGREHGPMAVAMVAVCIFAVPYFSQFSTVLSIPGILKTDPAKDPLPAAIQKITQADERIHVTTLSSELYINANRLPLLSAPSSVPWMYEMFKEKELDTLKAEKPRVIIFMPDWNVWGYSILDYAPELVAYVEENYSTTSGNYLEGLYIRNDYLDEAKKLLDIYPISIYSGNADTEIGPLDEGTTESQVFTAKHENMKALSVLVTTYQQENATELTVQMYDMETGELIHQETFDPKAIQDMQYAQVGFSCQTQIGKAYELRFLARNIKPDRVISLYKTADGSATEKNYAMINGEAQTFSLCLNVFAY